MNLINKRHPSNFVDQTGNRKKEKSKFVIRMATILLAIGYLACLNHVYVSEIAPRYGYSGLKSIKFSFNHYLISGAFAALCACFVPTQVSRASTGIIAYLFYTVVLPSFLIPIHLTKGKPQEYLFVMIAIAVNFILLCLLSRMKPITLRPFTIGRSFAIWLLVIAGLATIGIRLYLFRDIEFDFNFNNVYDRRLSARNVVGSRSFVGYFLNIGTSGVGLVMILLGITKKKYWLLLFGAFLYLLMFLTIGSKGALFIPLLLVSTLLVLRYFPNYFIPTLGLALLLLCVAATFEYRALESRTLSSYVIRRQLVIPAVFNLSHFTYFSENPFYYWSDSFLRWFIKCPYPTSKAMWMGRLAGSNQLAANANMWASAFADAGYIGMLVMTACTSVVCRVLDGIAVRLGPAIMLLAGFGIASKLSNTSFERVMITHGALAIICFLYLLQPLAADSDADPRASKLLRR